jgi:hypothetical protein
MLYRGFLLSPIPGARIANRKLRVIAVRLVLRIEQIAPWFLNLLPFFKSACKFLCSSSRASAFSTAATLSHLCKELLLASVKVPALDPTTAFFINTINLQSF